MNRVFVHVAKSGADLYDGKASFDAVVVDDFVEDIEFSFLAEPDFLDRDEAEIAAFAAQKDGEAYDVVSAAVMNGSPVYVNDADADTEALKAAFPKAPSA